MDEPRLTAVSDLFMIAEYHNDVVDALPSYFRLLAQNPSGRLFGCSRQEVDALILKRIDETEVRSAFAVLSLIEAAIRIDYTSRVKGKLKDHLSRNYREMYRKRKERARLDEDLLEVLTTSSPEIKPVVSELRAALKYRHWIAHGRYWTRPNNGRFDFLSIYRLGELFLGSGVLYKD